MKFSFETNGRRQILRIAIITVLTIAVWTYWYVNKRSENEYLTARIEELGGNTHNTKRFPERAITGRIIEMRERLISEKAWESLPDYIAGLEIPFEKFNVMWLKESPRELFGGEYIRQEISVEFVGVYENYVMLFRDLETAPFLLTFRDWSLKAIDFGKDPTIRGMFTFSVVAKER